MVHPSKRQFLFYLPMSNQFGSNTAVIFDFQTKTWLVRRVPQEVTIAFNFDDNIYIGTKDGYILREFSGKTFNGSPIEAYWKSPWFDFGDDSSYKSFREFRIQIEENETNRFLPEVCNSNIWHQHFFYCLLSSRGISRDMQGI